MKTQHLIPVLLFIAKIFFLVCIFFYVFSIYLLMYLIDSKLTFSIAEFHDFKER